MAVRLYYGAWLWDFFWKTTANFENICQKELDFIPGLWYNNYKDFVKQFSGFSKPEGELLAAFCFSKESLFWEKAFGLTAKAGREFEKPF